MLVKHATASVFVFGRLPDGWRLGLIQHPRLGLWMLPGGHVETDETAPDAALREVEEEAAVTARLLHPSGASLPAGFPHPPVAMPWWIVEMPVPADNHLAFPHVHVDHQYVAVADPTASTGLEPVHPFAWWSAAEIGEIDMVEDSRMQAKDLFEQVEELTSRVGAASF